MDLDAVIGNKYDYTYYDYNTLTYVTNRSFVTPYKKTDAGFEKIKGAENKFDGLEVYGKFVPQFADADGDNDLDIISGNYFGEVVFFRNDAGVYTQEIELSPFAGIIAPYYSAVRLVDIDNDTDLDLFITNNYEIRYYKNTGSAQTPVYTEELDLSNPLDFATAYQYNTPYLNFTDLDHDGDFDLQFNGGTYSYYTYYATHGLWYFENTGTAENPVFETPPDEVLFSEAEVNARMELIDYDADGDLDLFAGNDDGSVSYLKNENERVVTSVTSIVPLYSAGGPPVVIEPGLTLSDPDDDLIIQATVAVNDFESGETLSFTPAEGITGSFDAASGVLTFRGKANVSDYQSLLRTVAFEDADAEAGRKKPNRKLTYAKIISFAVYDIDFTNPQIVPKTINVFVNSPPLIQPEPISTPAGSTQTINLISITSDVDDNLDPLLFSIAKAPASGAKASIQVVSTTQVNLLLDYSGVTFHGTDQLTIRACDALGACSESILLIDIDVDGEITVFNAVAPNSGGDNRYMRIIGLPEGHKINIYNRWGDQVYDAENYLNTFDGNAFKGNGKNGNPLPTGTYFYTIEIPGKKMISGYLTLKQ